MIAPAARPRGRIFSFREFPSVFGCGAGEDLL